MRNLIMMEKNLLKTLRGYIPVVVPIEYQRNQSFQKKKLLDKPKPTRRVIDL